MKPFLYLLNDESNKIPGAGGSFNIDPETGAPVGRRLPIVELRPDGTTNVLAFEQPPAD